MQLVAVAGHGSWSGNAEPPRDNRPGRAEISGTLHLFFGDNVDGFTQLTQRIEGIAGGVEILAHGVFGSWCE